MMENYSEGLSSWHLTLYIYGGTWIITVVTESSFDWTSSLIKQHSKPWKKEKGTKLCLWCKPSYQKKFLFLEMKCSHFKYAFYHTNAAFKKHYTAHKVLEKHSITTSMAQTSYTRKYGHLLRDDLLLTQYIPFSFNYTCS